MTTTQDEADLLAERCFDQWDINRIRPAVASEFRYLMTKITNAEASHLETIDERDRLKGEIARLRAALEPFAREADRWDRVVDRDADRYIGGYPVPNVACLRKARAALLTEGGKQP